MYTGRTLDGSPEDLIYPSFRYVNFSDEGAIVLVSTHLRHAWTAAPGADVGAGAVGAFIAASHNRSEAERRAVPQNPNKDEVHTPWRDEIYHQWNHVFYDVANFLTSVGPGIGHLHPPAHNAFALTYPVADGEGEAKGMVWDDNVLVIPAHLEPGVAVRMSTLNEDGEEKTLGTFNESTTADIWYIKEGTSVRFFVEGEYENVRGGVAAVLVCGRLDLTCPGHEGQNEEANEEESEGEEKEEDESQTEDGDEDDEGEDEDEDEECNEDEYEQSNDEWEDNTTDEVATSQTLSHSYELPTNGSFE
jgi:hypothetical protein